MARETKVGVVVGCVLALLPALASGEVKMRTRADGTLEIFNDGVVALSQRRPLELRPVPSPQWESWIRTHAAAAGIDPRLVQALMQAESAYNPRAVSKKGAMGLMQLMPGTAREVAVTDAFDPEQNIRGGVAYLRRMLDIFGGRTELAVAAYNAGPGAVQRYAGIPPYAETRQYVERVLGLYRGGGMLVGISAAGGTARPNGLAQAAVPSALQRALAGGSVRREAPAAVRTAPQPATVLVRSAPTAAPPAAVPALARAAGPAVVAPAAVAAAEPVEAQPAVAAVVAGGG
jgi:hypothetical protein